jgi:hypothetical protein
MKKIAFVVLLLLSLLACRQTIPFSTPAPATETATPTPTPTPDIATATPTYKNCFWNWAYGPGSPEFDAAVTEQLTAEGIQATVTSSSYGEVYSCDNSYHAKDLDVTVQIQVAGLQDQTLLAETATRIYALLEEKEPISGLSGLGNINLSFINADGSSTCYWHPDLGQCQP